MGGNGGEARNNRKEEDGSMLGYRIPKEGNPIS